MKTETIKSKVQTHAPILKDIAKGHYLHLLRWFHCNIGVGNSRRSLVARRRLFMAALASIGIDYEALAGRKPTLPV